MTASVAVGRKAAWAKAIGSKLTKTSAVPAVNSEDKAINTHPKLKLARLMLKPKPTLRFESHRPTGHCRLTRRVNCRAINALLWLSVRLGRYQIYLHIRANM